MYLSPWRPTFRTLRQLKEAPVGHNAVELYGEDKYLTFHQLARQVASTDAEAWSLRAYELVNAPRPIAAYDPRVVTASKLPREHAWGQRGPVRKAPDVKGAGGAWEAEVEAIAAQAESSSSEDEVGGDAGEPGYREEDEDAASIGIGGEDEGDDMDLFWSESEVPDALSVDGAVADEEPKEESAAGDRPPSTPLRSSSSSSSSSGTSDTSSAPPAAEVALVAEAGAPAPPGRAAPAEPASARGPRAAAADLQCEVPGGACCGTTTACSRLSPTVPWSSNMVRGAASRAP
jgi:hypothetical protein